MYQYIEKEYKTSVRVRKYLDYLNWERYALQPYDGCAYNCLYCNSKNGKDDYESTEPKHIIVKINLNFLLEQRFRRSSRLLPDIVGISSRTDPYQTAEKIYKITQDCLFTLAKFKFPVNIETKSDLVLRDMDILELIGRLTWCNVTISLSSININKSNFLEPNTISPLKRLETISKIKRQTNNVYCGIMMAPIIPGISDTSYELEECVKAAKDFGADYFVYNHLNMEPGYAEPFLSSLFQSYPDLKDDYQKIFRFHFNSNYYSGSYEADDNYRRTIAYTIINLCEKYNIPFKINRYIPQDYRKYNYELASKFMEKSVISFLNNTEWKRYFWAALNIQNLTESVSDILKRYEISTVKQIDKDMDELIDKILRKEIY